MPVGIPRWKGRLAPSAELEGVPMPIVGGLDIHRKRIAFDYLDTVTGEVRRGQIAPADRAHLRAWLVRFAGGPCRDSRPGERLESEEYTVMPSPANRTALREEENRPCPASQQVSASAVTGPAPYSLAARTLAPVRCRAASSSSLRNGCSLPSMAAGMSRAVATCSCPSDQ